MVFVPKLSLRSLGSTWASMVATVIGVVTLPMFGAPLDRHPELKSRAVAWTEFDGSYLVDTSSRAEMLDFFWTVFNRPYPDHGWTGSVNPPVAGTTSELWRIREYAQLNAYRALNGSPPMSEDPSKIEYVQAAALVFAQNPTRDVAHKLDSTWIGYNEIAADAAANSLLTGNGLGLLNGVADAFIADGTTDNAAAVGHRSQLLHDNSVVGTLGSSGNARIGWADVWNQPLLRQTNSLAAYVAYPSPGYFPIAFFGRYQAFRWSFVPASDWTEFRAGTDSYFYGFAPGIGAKDSTVTAKINGVSVNVNNLVRNNPPGPLTWDFGSYLDLVNDKVPDGTIVEVTIHDVGIETPGRFYVTGYRDYTYTVTLFDENKIVTAGFSPKTPLVNISTRSVIGVADQQMIAGFSVSGVAPVRVAIRTQGPGLAQYGVQNAARSSHIRVYDSASNLLGENAGWRNHPDWRMLESLNVAPSHDNEAAMVLTLWPGNYTAIVSDDTGSNGVGIVEAFNIDNLTETKLDNLSTRGLVGAGDNQMIAGLTIKDTPRTVVIRTQGPGLARYGVTSVVADTVLTVVAQNDGHIVAQNDDWRTDARNERLSTDLSAFAPSDPREAALVLTLPPGAYTALVSAKTAPGVGIVEVFDVSP